MKIDKTFLLAAAFIFEREKGLRLGDYESSLISESGILALELGQIERILAEFIENNLSSGCEGLATAIFALGKRQVLSKKQFLINVLEKTLVFDMSSAYQAMIALENIGESIFSSLSSVENVEMNKKLAIKFLKSQNA